MADAPRRQIANDFFEGVHRAYYETRKFQRTKDHVGPTGTRFRGRLSIKASCLPIEPDGPCLAGQVLSWECSVCPDKAALEQISAQHKGSVGELQGDVSCVVSQKYANIPDPI
jgi:hypothetical protein